MCASYCFKALPPYFGRKEQTSFGKKLSWKSAPVGAAFTITQHRLVLEKYANDKA
jgi:hypothetical protein